MPWICVGCAEKFGGEKPDAHDCPSKIADGVDPASLVRPYTEKPKPEKPKATP